VASAYEQAVTRFRDRLLRVDATAMQAVTDAYAPIRTDLLKQIADLEKVLPDAQTASDLYKLKRYKSLIAQIEKQTAQLASDAGAVIRDGQASLVSIAQDEVKSLATVQAGQASAQLAVNVSESWTMLNHNALVDLVGRLSDGSPLRDYLDALPEGYGSVISDELVKGIALGKHPRAISQDLTQRLDGQVARLLTTTRTAMLDSYRSASLRSMSENGDILDGWQWQAAHDRRTCLACLALDGTIHPVTETFMGSHAGCRCSPRPVVTGGVPSARETGQQWFDRQSEGVQNSMLPAYAEDAYHSGQVTLQDFVHLDKDPRWGDRYRQGSVRELVV